MATTVEAILGAVEIDGGSDALLQVATHLKLIPESIIPVMSKKKTIPCIPVSKTINVYNLRE